MNLIKNNKLLIVLLSVLLVSLSGCNSERYNDRNKLVDDGKYVAGMTLPKDATNKKYIGNGWFVFKLYGECFMYGDKGRSSTITRVRCKAN